MLQRNLSIPKASALRRRSGLVGIYIHPSAAPVEAHAPIDQRRDRVISTQPDVSSRHEFCAALTHNDVTGYNHLAAEFFHTQPFTAAVAPVFNAALSFFMSH